jgi:L-iditol 2-dehydrogenase
MKALVLHGIGDLRVDDVPEPEAGPGQVKVRVQAVGVCGSDVHYYTHGRIGDQVVEKPIIVGHEGAGEIVELGEGVEGLSAGQRVAIEPALSCGRCEWCLTGKPNVCPNVRFCSTPPIDGLMCEFAVLAAHQCEPIPDALSWEEAAMLEPLQISVHAANLIGTVPGETAAVVGAGCIGLGCMEMAKVGGAARILVTDKLDYRLDLARRLGADETVNVSDEDPAEAVQRLTDGRGADLVFECTNRCAGAPQAYDLSAIGGRVCLVGIPEEDEITLDAHHPRRKELRIQYVRRSRHAARQAMTLVATGRLDVASWVTHRVGLDDAKGVFDTVAEYADGVLKAVVLPND